MQAQPEQRPRHLDILEHASKSALVMGLGCGVIDLAAFMNSLDIDQLGGLYSGLQAWEVVLISVLTPMFVAIPIALVQGLWLTARSGRLSSRTSLVTSVVFTCAFGASWHHTLMQGDGLTSHPNFMLIRVASLLVLLGAMAAWAWLMRAPTTPRILLAGAAGIGLWGFSSMMLPLYTSFHFHAVLFGFWSVGYALWFSSVKREDPSSSRSVYIASAIATLCMIALGVQYGRKPDLIRPLVYELSLSKVIAQHEPFGVYRNNLEFDLDVVSGKHVKEIEDAFIERMTARRTLGSRHEEQDRPRAKHVLIVVLESMRSDSWADKELAPGFAKWREHGTYIPRAIAQYPATPLAYGAMFLSQTPYVLVQSPYWAKETLVDHLLAQKSFTDHHLSRPSNPWFDKTAINDFIVNPDTKKHVHTNSAKGLRALKAKLIATSKKPDEQLFSWIHIYDAHAPYKLHADLRKPKKGEPEKLSAYLSEVRHVDRLMDEFMTWYFAQPISKETLLIVISDHGEGMGDRVNDKTFWGHHVHVHQSVSHIPLFIAGPGVKKNATIDATVAGQLDVMPTVFDAIGEDIPERFYPQGRSLYDHVSDQPNDASETIDTYSTEAFAIRGAKFFEFIARTANPDKPGAGKLATKDVILTHQGYSPKIGIQQGTSKLVYDRAIGNYKLYDLAADPDETFDISGVQPDELTRMKSLLQQWHIEQRFIIERLDSTP